MTTLQPQSRERSAATPTIGVTILSGADRPGAALRWKDGERWSELSYRDFVRTARGIAKGLIALGIHAGDRVSILSNTRPEWTLADAGSVCAGAVVAPIYQTNSPEECQYVLAHSGARVVFCEDDEQVAKIEAVRADCPALEHVVGLGHSPRGGMSLDELIARGAELPDAAVDERVAAVSPDDVVSIVYTSGTTGPPKGCMLTHRNVRAGIESIESRLHFREDDDEIVFFIFLPLAHVYARGTQMLTLDLGGTIAYWTRDTSRLLDDIREARPTHFASVPRIWEKIHTAATSGIAEQPRVKRALFEWALGVGHEVRERSRAQRSPGALLALQHRIADRLVLAKVRDLFGGRVRFAVTGAAPTPAEVVTFFDACGLNLVEGWGMTETCSVGAINTEREWKLSTVGRPLPDAEMRIADDGELMMRAPYVMTGYYQDPEASARTLPDGWLATGDLARIDDDGYVWITGRKKDLIITSSGKNISPSNIENALKESRWISEALVFGDGKPYLVAMLTLDPEEAPRLAAQVGVAPDVATMARDQRVHAEIQRAVDVANARFARIEQIKRFAILDHDLTQEAGELTPTLKTKRAPIEQRYGDVLRSLYEG